MAEVTYSSVTWTAGDIITEAKLDSMVANDRAVDSMYQGIELVERAAPSTPGANKVHVYAKDKGGVATIYAINDGGTEYELSEGQPTFGFTVPGTVATGGDAAPGLIAQRALTIVKAYAYAITGPVGADLIFDINKNGTSIWASTPANRVRVADGANAGTQTSFDTTALVEGDILRIDVDQVGSGTAGANATVQLKCK